MMMMRRHHGLALGSWVILVMGSSCSNQPEEARNSTASDQASQRAAGDEAEAPAGEDDAESESSEFSKTEVIRPGTGEGEESEDFTPPPVGDPPVIGSVTFEVDSVAVTSVHRGQTVSCEASVTDPDDPIDVNDPGVTYEYVWSNDANLNGSFSGSEELSVTTKTIALTTLNSTIGTDSLQCEVTVEDFQGNTDSKAAQVSVVNAPPESTAALTPVSAFEDDTLTCTPTTTDEDGTTSFTYVYSWTVAGVSTGTTAATLTGTHFDKGQEVICTLIPNDGDDDGDPASSNGVTISNTAPVIPDVTLTPPSGAVYGDTLTCTPDTPTDADGDSVTLYTYKWYVNNLLEPSLNTTSASATDTISTEFKGDDEVYCTVTATDGTNSSDLATSNTIDIDNTAPVLGTVFLTPLSAETGDELVCTPGTPTDVDGDTSFTYTYSWTINTTTLGSSFDDATLPAETAIKDDVVYCTVVPSDGTDAGAPEDSNEVTIGNSAPSATGASIAFTSGGVRPIASDELVCSIVGYDDPDGDADNSTFAWTVDSAPSSETSNTLDSSETAEGDPVVCIVTPSDGEDDSATDVTESVNVNSTPTVDAFNLATDAGDDDIYTNDVIDIETLVSTDDNDSDTVSVTYIWYVNSTEVTGETDATLDGATHFDLGDTVVARVTPNDGLEDGAYTESGPTVIMNTTPVVTVDSVGVDGGGPITSGAELLCTASATDADTAGTESWLVDNIVFEWTNEAGDVLSSTDTYTVVPSEAPPGQDITCTATITDDVVPFPTHSDSGIASVTNIAPTVDTISIDVSSGVVGDTLTCSATASDPESTPTISYSWTDLAGTTIGTTTTTGIYVITGAETEPGEAVTCTATADDGEDENNTSTDTATADIDNTDPEIDEPIAVQVDGSTVTTVKVGEEANCLVTASDVDTDDPTLAYTWTNTTSTAVLAAESATSTYTLTADDTEVDDVLTCDVVATDPHAGEDTSSTTVTVENSLPVVALVTLDPETVYEESDVTCTVDTADVTDADEHDVDLSYTWTVDGSEVTGETDSVLPSSYLSEESEVYCTVTPNDGLEDGDPVDSDTAIATDCDVDGDNFMVEACLTEGADNNGDGIVGDDLDAEYDCDDDASTGALTFPGAAEFEDDLDCMRDDDGDGYGADNVDDPIVAGGDCKDDDSTFNPGFEESEDESLVGDDYDEDCDGQVVCADDADHDSYGHETEYSEGPSAEAGESAAGACGADDTDDWADNTLDCNDSVDQAFPGAAEIEDPDGDYCMADVDKDGYGSAETSGTATLGSDCDDSDDSFHPCAVEVCDGEDNDCDGKLDTLDPTYGQIPTGLDPTCADEGTEGGEADDLSIAYLFYLDDDDDGFGGNCSTAPTELVVEADGCCCDDAATNSDGDPLTCDGDGDDSDPYYLSGCEEENYCDGDGVWESGEASEVPDEDSECSDIIECGEAAPAGFVSECGCPDSTGSATFYCDANDDGEIDDNDVVRTFDPCDGFDCEVVQDEQTGEARSECTASTVTFYNTTTGSLTVVDGVFKYGLLADSEPEGVEDSNGDDVNDCGDSTASYYIDNDADGLFAEDVLCCFEHPDTTSTFTAYDTTLDRTAWSHNDGPGQDTDADGVLESTLDDDGVTVIEPEDDMESTSSDGCHGPYVWFYGEDHSDASIGYVEDLVTSTETLNYTALNDDQYAAFTLFGDDTLDCDDDDEYEYPGALEVCDGQRNDCTDSSAVDMTEVDTDNDGYVVCDFDGDGIGDGYTGAVPWAGSTTVNVGEDCDPNDPNTYPFAAEVCDGIYNNCNSRESSVELAPANELDDDADGYVECFDGTTSWAGADVPETGQDCDDTNIRVFPGAPEYCDGVFDDCDSLLYDTQEAPDPELDADGDGYVSCLYDVDYGTGPYAYDASIWVGSTISGDGDCSGLDETVYPTAAEVCDGQFNDCEDEDYGLTDAPTNELDDDGDDYVECSYALSTWQGAGDVVGGEDCDDEDGEVYPGATEVCDGQFNDCEDTAFIEGSAPDDEVDNDGDGFVECLRNRLPVWAGEGADPYDLCPGAGTCYDCDDDDDDTFPGAAELELDNDECMTDADGDGYGYDLAEDPIEAGTDCDDSLEEVHPGAEEDCEPAGEEVDDDCDGSPNTQNGLPLEDVDSEMVGYLDQDGDGFGDPDHAATICVSGDGYSLTGTDCNDSDPSKYPGAAELCNGTDDDCDEITDEADDLDPELSGCVDMYRDVDQDLYGDAEISSCLCLAAESATSEKDGDQYVLISGDCDDYNSNTHPLSCEDGIDNDEDDLEDALDPDCVAGLNEEGTAVETRMEIMDGDDNDCDGYVPVVELDCDDDGALPILPRRVSLAETAAEAGLLPCDQTAGFDVENPYAYTECWDEELVQLVCDREGEAGGVGGSGFWMLRYEESDDGYGGRYEGGDRVYEKLLGCDLVGDCDDLCASRCPGADEVCDGVDNDCTDTDGFYSDTDGIPDALSGEGDVAGTVSVEEFDLDLDGYLNCDDFSTSSGQVHYTSDSCDDAVVEGDLLVDCNNQCALTNPAVEERCNGFLDTCGGEAEGADLDRDDFRTCGAWSSGVEGTDEMIEDSHLVVWVRGANSLGVDEEEEEEEDEEVVDTGGGIDSATTSDSGSQDTSASDTAASTTDTAGDTGVEGSGVISTTTTAAFVPLILPRTMYCENPDLDYTRRELRAAQEVIACDQELYAQLIQIIDSDTVDEALADCDATPLLDACTDSLEEGGCGLIQISLDSTIDQDTRDDYIEEAMQAGYHSASCDAAPEQYIARSTWTHKRVLEARQNVVEFECMRMYGLACEDIDESTGIVSTWDELADASVALAVERRWWKEIERFEPEAITSGTLGHCWGDPGDGFEQVSQETGGDCNDDDDASHRDLAEGPGDLLGVYYGLPVDCATCLDGIDNNCDGQVDCADPACAACFVGQGYGCGAGDDNPCSENGSGCSAGRDTVNSDFKRISLVFFLGLFAVALRRRSDS